MAISWKQATAQRLFAEYGTFEFSRQDALKQVLDEIIELTHPGGYDPKKLKSPEQTFSRTLQELRKDGVVIFIGRGRYHISTSYLPCESLLVSPQYELITETTETAELCTVLVGCTERATIYTHDAHSYVDDLHMAGYILEHGCAVIGIEARKLHHQIANYWRGI